MRNSHRESGLQRACFTWFRYQYPKLSLNLVAIPNGGKRTITEAAIRNGEGVVAGVSDAVLFVPSGEYHTLCIEFKTSSVSLDANGKIRTPRTYQSPAQKNWQEAVESQGNKYIIVRSLDEFMDGVNEYLSDK